jgi:hypothetical protein
MSIVSMLSGSPAFQATAARVCMGVSLTLQPPASGSTRLRNVIVRCA